MTAAEKYSAALNLYSSTGMSISEISARCGVSRKAFANYIQRNHRELMYRRHGIDPSAAGRKLWAAKGQKPATRAKYRRAVEACDSEEYIDLNISQIARLFGVDASGLSNQLKTHYSEILERRENERQRLGIADNHRRGARVSTQEAYAEPLRLLIETDMTIEEAAEACAVSFTGLRQYILHYHKELVAARESRRAEGKKKPGIGRMSGNGSIRRPRAAEAEKYAEAVELYRSTSLTAREICAITGHDSRAFGNHMRMWHQRLIFERNGLTMPENSSDRPGLGGIPHYSGAVSEKYAPAIEALEAGEQSVESVARRFGFIPEVFRAYLKKHRPELWKSMGMTELPNGRRVSRRSTGKYSAAIELYRTTPEPLKSIAERLGINYNSIGGFLRRNMPEIIEAHNALAAGQEK